MIPKIQGSTQMPAQVQQQETEAAKTNEKKSDMNNGPVSEPNDLSRTAPPVQTRDPASDLKFEAHRMAADLNAQLNTINSDKPKPPQTNALYLEEYLISGVKDPDKTPCGEEGPKPEPKAVKNLQWMVDGLK